MPLPVVKPGVGEILNMTLGSNDNPKLVEWMNNTALKMKEQNPHLHECFFHYIKSIAQSNMKLDAIDISIAGMIIYDLLARQDEVDEMNRIWK